MKLNYVDADSVEWLRVSIVVICTICTKAACCLGCIFHM